MPEMKAEAAAGGAINIQGIILAGRQQMSLFGHAVGDRALLSSEGGAKLEKGDPFAPRQRYEVKSEIGHGGMGVVYEALDTVLGRRVALKVIRQALANPLGYEQFLIEARAIALLSHPNVVTIYDMGLMDLQHYLAMEFVGGGNLWSLVRGENTLPLKETLRLFLEISRGLQSAHEAGIVHRDIKPQNILLTEKREAKITDFGLAKIRRKSETGLKKSLFDASGTPGFTPPEQTRGEEAHPCFDIYALGVTLFCMLAGTPPHEIARKTALFDIIKFQESGERVSLRELRPTTPESIEQIYFYCTAPDPKERYPSIAAFLPAVEKLYASLQ